ncbi:ankyrin repeat and LEM domain-containing protein 2 [Metopolophium dirhodum]|uniref:ankyrin repeat and LEM domain-containing protein 2 n=1 Tax=Metopolophium dirhodum TaxID=44670 RepID=UPI00298FFBC1|nr:ankyrin repeat and LEM domain-containing protein 2 [Metopolophium dirhodum]XP_060872005.1 ankyrin repeat and LEM domain-containing protein 2 [Metopolophium dirhodum]
MDSSNAANVSDDEESFYGVFVESDVDNSSTPRVFTNFQETLSAVKSNKTSRFKLFRSATEAEQFSVFGQELPIKQIEKSTPNVSTSFTFKSLKSEDLVAFRRLIESGELDKVKLAVNSNPRFLVSSGDTPSIIQEGCRYNAMHVAARFNQPQIVHFIMECVTSSEFIKSLYGTEESYLSRSEIITDLYLNTPDKAANDTPLHIASKFGHVDVVRELISYDKCILTSLNKYLQTPKDVICSRNNKEMYNDILHLIENGFFVPMWKSDDDCAQPTIGKPFSPKSSTIIPPLQNDNLKSLNPILEIRAVAGPMNESQALKFWKDWKSPVRKTLLSPSPKKSPSSPKQNEFKNKSIEKTGRNLAEKEKVGWAEYWPFLDKIVDLKSNRGLDLLEKYLRQRFSMKEQDYPVIAPPRVALLSPMGELCKALESMRIGANLNRRSPRENTVVSYTCVVKSCKVLAERLSNVIISEYKNMLGIESLAIRLCHEVRHLMALEDSFYSDSRFDSKVKGRIHGRVAEHLCQLLINNLELVSNVSLIVTKLQKYYACHAIGSRSEITGACLVTQIHTILTEKSSIIHNMQSDDDDELSCKQWFSTAVPCLCSIETKRLKPKQLFCDNGPVKRQDENEESKNMHGYDSDDDVFSSAPTSPCSEYSSSDESDASNMFHNAERDFAYLLFSSDVPIVHDYEIFDAINGINVDSNKYPWLYRWLYSMNDYNNLNNL